MKAPSFLPAPKSPKNTSVFGFNYVDATFNATIDAKEASIKKDEEEALCVLLEKLYSISTDLSIIGSTILLTLTGIYILIMLIHCRSHYSPAYPSDLTAA